MNTAKHANKWTLTRRVIDGITQQLIPGKHHTVWGTKETAK